MTRRWGELPRRSVLTRVAIVLTGLPMLVVCVMMLLACARLLAQEPEHSRAVLWVMLLWHAYWAFWLVRKVARALQSDAQVFAEERDR